jgi:hypothetical protein
VLLKILKYDIVRDVAAGGEEVAPSPEMPPPVALAQVWELHLHPNSPLDYALASTRATIRKWLRLVARDAGRLFGEGSADREHVADFVYRHRLSVAWAYHRRIRRADVVLAIALYEKAKVS